LWLIMLTALQNAFVLEYPKDWDGKHAAMRVGVSENTAAQAAYRWLTNPEVAEAIEERKKDLAAAAGLSVEWVLRQWKEIAEADPAELIYMELRSCRHCHGLNHEFQWSEFEYRKAVEAAQSHVCNSKCEQPCVKRIPPIPNGGFGFDPSRAPAPDCPQCHGNGEERVGLADTRRLKGPARRLYAGIKQTQHGIEVKMRDQDGARDNIAKYLGMLIDKRELSGPNGTPIAIAGFTAADLTDDQIAQMLLQEQSEA
jgi:phage terminase small subunit